LDSRNNWVGADVEGRRRPFDLGNEQRWIRRM